VIDAPTTNCAAAPFEPEGLRHFPGGREETN